MKAFSSKSFSMYCMSSGMAFEQPGTGHLESKKGGSKCSSFTELVNIVKYLRLS